MQMQNCGGRDGDVGLGFLPWNVAVANMPTRKSPGIANFDPHLGGANGGVQDRTNVGDAPLENFIGIGVQTNLSVSPTCMFRRSFS